MALPRRTDVLIVGAGPAGLALAVTLAQLGIDHVVIDGKPAAAPGTKAAAIQPRTLEYLDRVGLADTLIADGLRGGGFAVADPDAGVLMRMSYESIDSPFPFLLLIGQQQTEIRLAERLEALGGHVHRAVTLLDLHDDFPGTAATVVDDDGLVHAISSRYVAGADGVHSSVRRIAGIDFSGDAPAALFALADIMVSGTPADSLDTVFSLSHDGMLITSPLPGGQLRVVAGVSAGTPAPDQAAVIDLLAARGGEGLRDVTVESVASTSTYRVQQKVAATLRRGNVFLLGDAAHTHSPAGGQGMNTGIQDAANLGWKLHHALTGRATPELLDTYDVERRPVAAHLIAFTSQLMQVATITEPAAAQIRNDVLSAAGQVPGVTEWLTRNLSQLDIGYNTDHGATVEGIRVDPRVSKADGLSWTSIMDRSGRSVAVRPDGIAADPLTLSERFGISPERSRS